MQIQLKDEYGRRSTPGTRILLVIVIALFGLCTALTATSDPEKDQMNSTVVK